MMTLQDDRKDFISFDDWKWLYVAFIDILRLLAVSLFRALHGNTYGVRSLNQ
jgi:hypothetical protein